MQGADRPLVLDPQSQRDELAGVEVLEERGGVVLVPGDGRVEPDPPEVRQEALKPVVAEVDEVLDPD
jgi:hypothetical protein